MPEEKTRKCSEPECRAHIPEKFAFCATHKWAEDVPPPKLRAKLPKESKFFERRTEQGILKCAVTRTQAEGWVMSLSHQSKISKRDGTPIFNRPATYSEIRNCVMNFAPPDVNMGLVFPTRKQLGERPELDPIVTLYEMALRGGEEQEDQSERGPGGSIIID